MSKIDNIISDLEKELAIVEHKDETGVVIKTEEVLAFLRPLYNYASANERTITYKDGSTTLSTLTPKTYVEGYGCDLPTYTKSGYTFDGWYKESDFSGTKLTKISKQETGNITLYAKTTEITD